MERQSLTIEPQSFEPQRRYLIIKPLSSTNQPLPAIIGRISSNIGRQSSTSQPLSLPPSTLVSARGDHPDGNCCPSADRRPLRR